MKYKTTFLLLIFALGSITAAIAQSRGTQLSGRNTRQMSYRDFVLPGTHWEAGLSLGASNAMTDIASGRPGEQASLFDVDVRGTMPALAVYGRYHTGRLIALKSSFSAIWLKGNDIWSPEIEIAERGKAFSNTVYEASLLGEFYLPRSITNLKRDFRYFWLDLYLFSGVTAFYHDPELTGPVIDDYDEVIINADNLYNNYQLAIPMGAGLNINLYNQWTIGLDFNFRYTFFDYLDGFRRPYSNRSDFYFSGNFNVGYIISSKPRRSNESLWEMIFDRN
ncbi:MAG: DUF6089 family protein [Bacteroidales bacterium]